MGYRRRGKWVRDERFGNGTSPGYDVFPQLLKLKKNGQFRIRMNLEKLNSDHLTVRTK